MIIEWEKFSFCNKGFQYYSQLIRTWQLSSINSFKSGKLAFIRNIRFQADVERVSSRHPHIPEYSEMYIIFHFFSWIYNFWFLLPILHWPQLFVRCMNHVTLKQRPGHVSIYLSISPSISILLPILHWPQLLVRCMKQCYLEAEACSCMKPLLSAWLLLSMKY